MNLNQVRANAPKGAAEFLIIPNSFSVIYFNLEKRVYFLDGKTLPIENDQIYKFEGLAQKVFLS